MKGRERINTNNKDESLSVNPFAQIDFSKTELAPKKSNDTETQVLETVSAGKVKKQKIYIKQERGGRSGKTVTVLMGVDDVKEQKELLKMIQKVLGSGGTIKNEFIEIQGEKREEIAKLLEEKGYKAIFSGG